MSMSAASSAVFPLQHTQTSSCPIYLFDHLVNYCHCHYFTDPQPKPKPAIILQMAALHSQTTKIYCRCMALRQRKRKTHDPIFDKQDILFTIWLQVFARNKRILR